MSRASLFLSAWLLGACSGGTITVACEEARCDESCRDDGNASGVCRDDMCMCRPVITPPSGVSVGLSSGGVVERRAGDYALTLTVGPVEPAAERSRGGADLELGLPAAADPARGVTP